METTNETQSAGGNAPVHKVRIGLIEANIWRNEGKNGAYHTVTFERRYPFDDRGNTIRDEDPLGRVTMLDYDANDLVISRMPHRHLAGACFPGYLIQEIVAQLPGSLLQRAALSFSKRGYIPGIKSKRNSQLLG